MAVILFKLIFSFISTSLNLLTSLTLAVAARVVVQLIQAVKFSGGGGQRVLDHVKSIMGTCLEYLVELVMEVINAMLLCLVDLVKERVLGSLSELVAAVVELAEKTTTSAREVPELLEAFTEMVCEIVSDLLNNCNNAIKYVTENVFS